MIARCLAALALVASLAPGTALAREVVETARLRLVGGPSATGLVRQLAATAEEDRDAVARELGRDWDGVTEVRVAADNLEFRALLDGRRVPNWAIGVAFPEENLVVIQPASGQHLRETLRHEFSHIGVGRLARSPVPRWFLEGLASVHEDAPWSREGVSLVWAARTGHLWPFSSLADGFPAGRLDAELAYAQSADFVQYMTERSSPAAMGGIVRAVVAGEPFEAAVERHVGERLGLLERDWHASLLKWDRLLRILGSPELLWGAMTLLVLFAWFELRRRRRLRMRLMETEEQLEENRALAEQTGFWADQDEPPFASLMPAFDDEEDEEALREEPPKKPTLH